MGRWRGCQLYKSRAERRSGQRSSYERTCASNEGEEGMKVKRKLQCWAGLTCLKLTKIQASLGEKSRLIVSQRGEVPV